MKSVLKRLTLFVLAVCLLVSLAPTPASASTYEQDTKRWNIMLVIDGSGSLESGYREYDMEASSDPRGLRFEAIGSFLAVLQDDGHNVGAISYGDNVKNFGLYSMDDNDAAKLKTDIPNYLMREGNRYMELTRTYTALTEAAQTLKRDGDPNKDSAIFLFTDGKINRENDDSQQKAIEAIRDAGIKLCGVYLNTGKKDDLAGQQEMKETIRQANGRSASDDLEDCFLAITDAASCTNAIDPLMRMLGYDVVVPDPWTITSTASTRTFFVPGVGVEEASIRLNSLDGKPLPEMKVEISCDGGAPVQFKAPGSARDGDNLVYEQDTVHVYKIKKPQSGLWTVSAKTLNDETVNIYYTPIFSYDIDAVVDCTPASADLHMNMDVTVEAWLSQKGVLLTDPAKYVGYSCFVSINDMATGDLIKEIPVAADPNGRFLTTVKLEEAEGILYGINSGEYRVSARFQCGEEMKVVSEILTWNLKNQAPYLKNDPTAYMDIEYGLFRPETAEIDLSGRFEDREDGANLKLYIDGDQPGDGLELLGSRLVVTPKLLSDNHVNVNIFAKDQKDAESNRNEPLVVTIEATDVTVPTIIKIVIAVVIALLVIFLIIVAVKRAGSKLVPKGTGSVTIHAGGNHVTLTITCPGVGTKRTASMLTLINNALAEASEDSHSVPGMECRAAEVSPERLSEIVSEDSAELDKAIVAAKVVKGKGGKKEPILCVTYKKKSKDLRNSSYAVCVDDNEYEISYFMPTTQDDDLDEESNGGSRRRRKPAKKAPAKRDSGRRRRKPAVEDEEDEF